MELGSKEKLSARLKNSVNILLPLILSSLARIDTISNAMELRGFGKKKKRTWYVQRPFTRNDWLVLTRWARPCYWPASSSPSGTATASSTPSSDNLRQKRQAPRPQKGRGACFFAEQLGKFT